MATELLAAGTTAASSADFTLASGEGATLALKGADATDQLLPAITIELKDDTGGYLAIAQMREPVVLSAPGTYRVRRLANRGNVGVFRG